MRTPANKCLQYASLPYRSSVATLSLHFSLGKTRLETFAVLLAGLANCRTVNLSHLSSQFPGDALLASNYRRLQRFSQYVRLDQDVVAQLIVRLLNLSSPKLLVLDRTNWKLGKSDINILVLAVVTRRCKVPLMWSFLSHGGNSSTSQRKGLIQRYLRLFGASSIEALLADREFVGEDWMAYLFENNVPFVIRLREDMHMDTEDGRRFQLRSLLRKPRSGKWTGWLPCMDRRPENALRFEGKKLRDGELLLVATNLPAPENALCLYRKRWGIEYLFADAKTRGFNIEDTHITDHGKLATLLAVVALAMTWACRCANHAMGRKGIRKKATRGVKSSGSGSGLTHCGAGYCMIKKKPWRLGDEHVQSALLHSKSQAGFRYESCTVRDYSALRV